VRSYARIAGGKAGTDLAGYENGLPYRDLGPPPGRRRRQRDKGAGTFYARCAVLDDLADGIATGQDAYVCKSLAVSGWPFPA
jgi:hypothetical protein